MRPGSRRACSDIIGNVGRANAQPNARLHATSSSFFSFLETLDKHILVIQRLKIGNNFTNIQIS